MHCIVGAVIMHKDRDVPENGRVQNVSERHWTFRLSLKTRSCAVFSSPRAIQRVGEASCIYERRSKRFSTAHAPANTCTQYFRTPAVSANMIQTTLGRLLYLQT